MDAGIREFVRNRALRLCEYCCMPDEFDPLPFCIDHIISQQHHGESAESNLALSCFNRNSYKGPNIAALPEFVVEHPDLTDNGFFPLV